MSNKKLLEIKRRLASKGITKVTLTVDMPVSNEPYLDGEISPVRVSRHTGDVHLKLNFKVDPEKIRPIEQALKILKEISESED